MSLGSLAQRMVDRFGCTCSITTHVRAAVANQPWKSGTDTPSVQNGVPCAIRSYKPHEIKGLIQEGDQLLTIPVAGCATRPPKGASISVDGAAAVTVVDGYTTKYQADEQAHKLTVRGGAV